MHLGVRKLFCFSHRIADDMDGCRLVELGRQVSILLSNASTNTTHGDLTVIQAAQFAQLQFQAIPTAEANTWKVDSS